MYAHLLHTHRHTHTPPHTPPHLQNTVSTTSDIDERRKHDDATGRVSEGGDSATAASAYHNRLSIRTVPRAPSHASTADDADDFHSPRSAMSQASFLSAAPTFASVDSTKVCVFFVGG